MKNKLLQLIIGFVAGFSLLTITHAVTDPNQTLTDDELANMFDEKMANITGDITNITLDQAKNTIVKLQDKLKQAYINSQNRCKKSSEDKKVQAAYTKGNNDIVTCLYFDPPPSFDDIKACWAAYPKEDPKLGDAYKRGVEYEYPKFPW